MNLDRYTTEGQKFIDKEKETAALVADHYAVDIQFATFDAEKFDAYIYKMPNIVSGICEIKTRPYFNRKLKIPCTLDKLTKEGYLITAEKLYILQAQSRIYNVYSYIFVNLPHDKKILCFKVCDKEGEFLMDFKTDWTPTLYSCNDYKGDTTRLNAFLPIKNNVNFEYFDYK